jgi:hypothetical protein
MTKKQVDSIKEFVAVVEETKAPRVLVDYLIQTILEFYPNRDPSFRITLEDIVNKEYEKIPDNIR